MPRRLVLLACLVGSVQAIADPELDTVVVTARKQAESRDDLPLAVDVLDARQLEAAGAGNLQGVAAMLPGLGFESQFGAAGGVPTLRGLSQPSLAADNVGVYVDGVYQASRAAIDIDLLDIERVELLRGPQSALYGHSTFAGALLYVSREPSSSPEAGARFESGSDGLLAARGFWSGPLGETGWRTRIALGHQTAGGTVRVRSGDPDIGALRRDAVSLAIASPTTHDWSATLRARLSRSVAAHPAVAALQGAQYNCGSRDAVSGLWSYYCGEAPRVDSFALSPVHESRARVGQLQLQLRVPLRVGFLESDSSAYDGEARTFRDLDASVDGQLMGVCVQNVSCPLPGQPPLPTLRVVDVNQVLAQRPGAGEWTQELRWRTGARATRLLLGVALSGARDRAHQAIGAARVDLAGNEQLTALLPGTRLLSGAVSQFNRALVADPVISQVDQSLAITRRRSGAVFGALDLDWGPGWHARIEGRQNRERILLDSRIANFQPSFGTAAGARHFSEFTPRLSLMYGPVTNWSTYVSLARGARSGGINAVPGLAAEEQVFVPETNWTMEWGGRYSGTSLLRRLEGTVYYVDWRNTQTLGYASTPGVTSLITTNLAGIIARGVELQARLQPLEGVVVDAAYSYVDSTYRQGSDDPGSIAFCGLSATSSSSTFCTIGPPRQSSVNARRLVPWIDGNHASRAPRHSAVATVSAMLPGNPAGGALSMNLQASYQGSMYERGIEGLYFGERTLVNGRIAWRRSSWTLAVWATNLLDRTYIRSSFSRQPQFFPTQPRPMDMIYGERRRAGFSVEWQSAR